MWNITKGPNDREGGGSWHLSLYVHFMSHIYKSWNENYATSKQNAGNEKRGGGVKKDSLWGFCTIKWVFFQRNVENWTAHEPQGIFIGYIKIYYDWASDYNRYKDGDGDDKYVLYI